MKKYYNRIAFFSQYYTKKIIFKSVNRFPHFKKAHVNAFPAVHLKKLDGVDFTVKFSSELTVLVLAGIVAGLNIYFFSMTAPDEYSDTSYAAKVLSFVPEENEKLFAKNNTIKTVVAGNHSFISSARADSIDSTDYTAISPQSLQEGSNYINNDVLSQPSPDSIDGLIAKQIKVYETKPGDSLSSISKNFGVSQQTIIWANKLPDSTIKSGWFLLIPPTDGVIYKATSNDTLPDVAKKFGANMDTIIAYNGLDGAEDITGDQIIIVPGGRMPEPPKPSATPTPRSKTPSGSSPAPSRIANNGDGHIFPWGYCTWYVASKVYVPWGGNAKNWLTNARSYGAVTGSKPVVGAIVVTNENARYGHVALVEKVEDDKFLVSEMNYEKFGKVDYRWINTGSRVILGFIHP